MSTEGGHGDFAPQSDAQIELLRFLRARHGHVSTERVVSGMGLAGIYEFFSTVRRVASTAAVAAEIAAGDAGAVIGAHAQSRDDDACVAAIDLFLECYGAEVGNLALRTLPRAGLFIAGGIAPRLVDRMRAGLFFEAMRDKGRMRAVVETIPVYVILEPRVALFGAAAVARSLA
jgi:glucokinase